MKIVLSDIIEKQFLIKKEHIKFTIDEIMKNKTITMEILLEKLNNTLLYSVPYQHFTNAIEHYFNVLKSRLQKL